VAVSAMTENSVEKLENSFNKQIVALQSEITKKLVDLLHDYSLFTIRFLDKNTAIAAGRNKMIRIRFK